MIRDSNFQLMYDNVYHQMVEAGVAIELENPIMVDAEGNQVTDTALAVGRPTKFQLTKPNYVLFVDETGKNTNMKTDGKVGGQQFVVPVDGDCSTSMGAITDIHFSVLCFQAATGEPVMCAVIR